MHRYTIELRFSGPNLVPDDITALLALKPTTQWNTGEAANPKARDNALWGYGPGGEWREWTDFEQMLSALLDELELLGGKLEQLKARYGGFLWCGHFDSSFDGGPSFSPDLLSRLAQLGLPLYLDTYFVNDQPPDVGCTPR